MESVEPADARIAAAFESNKLLATFDAALRERLSKDCEIVEFQIGDERVRPFLDRLSQRLNAEERHDEAQARALVRDLVLALQAVLLVKHAPAEVADAFCASRADPESGSVFGQLPRGLDLGAIVERAAPQ